MTELAAIALELLEKYYDAKTTCIWEYSGHIKKSMDELDKECERYRELIREADNV